MADIPESARLFMSGLIERARKLKKTIAFPEGTDPRVLDAAARLARDGVVRPVLIGPKPAHAPEGVEFIDPATNSKLAEKYSAYYHERRRSKGITHMDTPLATLVTVSLVASVLVSVSTVALGITALIMSDFYVPWR